jgi:fructose-bisphosphate aldolase class II
MKELLDDAGKRNYAVGYFNGTNMEMIRAYIRAAEDAMSPIIIGTAEDLLQYSGFDWFGPFLLQAARMARVPVAVHLDHAYHFDVIMRALYAGFGSVMYDGSFLTYEENVKNSAEIAKIVHPMGVGLECELGKIGTADGEVKNTYTDPAYASQFVEKTGTDFLAVSVGTAHGVYVETPHIEFELLKTLRAKLNVPLVLHGGSGLTDEDFRKSIKCGIKKINIYTDVITAAICTLRKEASEYNYTDLNQRVESAMYEVTLKKIKIFGSDHKW